MELRMQPRTEASQRCLTFQISVTPRTRLASYRDYLGNTVHHFDVPGRHRQLVIVADSLVEVKATGDPPDGVGAGAWANLDQVIATGDYWEMLMPSHFAKPTPLLQNYASELGLASRDAARRADPLELTREMNGALFSSISYVPKSTNVDSPLDDALRSRRGVCQDYAHIMIALLRNVGIPARYVSGYLFQRTGDNTRSSEGATHAWVEALLPELGWTGFDPTNNMMAGDRHVRTAVGRDYFDVPPSRGVFKGSVESELTVAVRVAPSDAPPSADEEPVVDDWAAVLNEKPEDVGPVYEQEQQQQQ
ncbi:MAG: transglutaminase family protein [Acidobacteriota bacterium]|nr:transglutaminase family protein [Acidobacteriota bacterium]